MTNPSRDISGGESLLTLLFTFFVVVYANQIQKLSEQINFSKLCNFQLFASNIEGNITKSAIENCEIAA